MNYRLVTGKSPFDWAEPEYNLPRVQAKPHAHAHMYDVPTYYPHTTQKKYLLRRSYCHRGRFHSREVIDYINEKLLLTWLPEQIACTPCTCGVATLCAGGGMEAAKLIKMC